MNEQNSEQPCVLREMIGRVLVISINRPQVRNAVDKRVSTLLGAALESADTDEDVLAVIITGAGDASFCAGADLGALARQESVMSETNPEWGFAGIVRHPISKPVIAAVNGFCLGGGTEIALACDLVVAVETARFGLPEVKRGLVAGAGGLIRLPKYLPRKVAMRLILVGDSLSAEEALGWGLVNTVVPVGQSLPAAISLAEQICENAPLAVRASKRVAMEISGAAWPEEDTAWARNDAECDPVFRSADAREGAVAFTEKRKPVWSGR